MVRTEVVATQLNRGGVAPPSVTPGQADGYMFQNDGRVYIEVTNNNGGSVDFTMQIPGSVDGEVNTDKINNMGTGVTLWFGPFPVGIYNQPSDPKMVYIDFATVEASFDLRVYRA